MRGHALGPFSLSGPNPLPNPNLRVQAVMVLTPNGGPKQIFLSASPTDPVIINFQPNVDTAVPTGTNAMLLGNPNSTNAYFASGDTTPGTPGLGTAKKFVFIADTTLIGVLTSAAIAAALALTITSITSADTQTVTIGATTYTFNSTLTNTANNVLIGGSITNMAANLALAVNAGAGAGTNYGTGTVANASVTGTSAIGVFTATAKVPGAAGNSIAVSETLSNGSWASAGTVLANGADASTTGQMTIYMDA